MSLRKKKEEKKKEKRSKIETMMERWWRFKTDLFIGGIVIVVIHGHFSRLLSSYSLALALVLDRLLNLGGVLGRDGGAVLGRHRECANA